MITINIRILNFYKFMYKISNTNYELKMKPNSKWDFITKIDFT